MWRQKDRVNSEGKRERGEQAALGAEGKAAKPNKPTAAFYRTMKGNESLLC